MSAASFTPVILEGSHVRLEPLSMDHVPALLAVGQGPRDTYGFTTVPDTERAMCDYVATALEAQAARKAMPFATVSRRTGRVVGSTRFGNVEFWPWPAGSAYQRGAETPDVVEIGWTWLAAEAQRTAINTEAKLLMLTHAFERWRVHRVSLMTDARNMRSRNAILRIGAQFDGVVRAQRLASDGGIRDTACFSILDGEWRDVRARLEARLDPRAEPAATAGG